MISNPLHINYLNLFVMKKEKTTSENELWLDISGKRLG